jgi:hypothetical protein
LPLGDLIQSKEREQHEQAHHWFSIETSGIGPSNRGKAEDKRQRERDRIAKPETPEGYIEYNTGESSQNWIQESNDAGDVHLLLVSACILSFQAEG